MHQWQDDSIDVIVETKYHKPNKLFFVVSSTTSLSRFFNPFIVVEVALFINFL